jgi:hypothetical protein|eukprot:COSAG01_NODE_6696_length_3539_cov_5.693023_2_plen_175_part_00
MKHQERALVLSTQAIYNADPAGGSYKIKRRIDLRAIDEVSVSCLDGTPMTAPTNSDVSLSVCRVCQKRVMSGARRRLPCASCAVRVLRLPIYCRAEDRAGAEDSRACAGADWQRPKDEHIEWDLLQVCPAGATNSTTTNQVLSIVVTGWRRMDKKVFQLIFMQTESGTSVKIYH